MGRGTIGRNEAVAVEIFASRIDTQPCKSSAPTQAGTKQHQHKQVGSSTNTSRWEAAEFASGTVWRRTITREQLDLELPLDVNHDARGYDKWEAVDDES